MSYRTDLSGRIYGRSDDTWISRHPILFYIAACILIFSFTELLIGSGQTAYYYDDPGASANLR